MKLAMLAIAVTPFTVGCASDQSDWFRIHEARSAVTALSQSQAATRAPGDVARVEAELERAERALEEGRGDDVAQIAQIVLLRAHIVGAGAAEAATDEDIADAQAALGVAQADLDAKKLKLQAAKADLDALDED